MHLERVENVVLHALSRHSSAVIRQGSIHLPLSQVSIRVAAQSKKLEQIGIRSGERIVILEKDGLRAIVNMLALWNIGSIVVPLATELPLEMILSACTRCNVQGLLIHEQLWERFRQLPYGTAFPISAFECERGTLLFLRLQAEQPPPDNVDIAVLATTGGSSGSWQAAQLTHANLLFCLRAISNYLGLTKSDVLCVPRPLIHISAIIDLLVGLCAGANVVLMNTNNALFLPCFIEHYQATAISVVPTVCRMLLRHKLATVPKTLSSLRSLTLLGGPLSTFEIQQLLRIFPALNFYHAYGLTEASPRVSCLFPTEAWEKIGSVGKPLPEVHVKIVDVTGREAMPGKAGEITVKGPNVMRGYAGGISGRNTRLIGDTLYTGDLGYLDAEGYLYIRGRADSVINRGGEKICPEEIEHVIYQHPAVADVLVIGVPDLVFGEEIACFVVQKAGATLTQDEIRQWCINRLSLGQFPRIISFRDSLPKTPAGKIIRQLPSERSSFELSAPPGVFGDAGES